LVTNAKIGDDNEGYVKKVDAYILEKGNNCFLPPKKKRALAQLKLVIKSLHNVVFTRRSLPFFQINFCATPKRQK
jgi:hypothetical protein